MQTFIVLCIVLIAGWYVVRRFQKSYLSKSRGDCTGCCGCSGASHQGKVEFKDLRKQDPGKKIHGD
ncbi:MAG: FeoB-associated Cys-rich membrane protein [Desulfovibrionales bacterium]